MQQNVFHFIHIITHMQAISLSYICTILIDNLSVAGEGRDVKFSFQSKLTPI
uniref:Uncharacterized protein n=1 Tax=Anguilla anguilla TaxID=7936 RepID=A0A0E9PV35_ANGAN